MENTMKDILLITADLSLFGEGGGDGGATGAAETSGDSNTMPAAPEQGQSRKGEYTNTFFGKLPEGVQNTGAADQMGAEVPEVSAEDIENQFRSDIRGKYKDAFTKETQKIINNRFKETKNLQKQLGDQQGIIDSLMQRYNVQDGDLTKLQKAMDDDYNMWADAADREGLSVDTYKEIFKVKQRNAQLERENAARESQQRADAQYNQWMSEAEEVKKSFPSFDINQEIQNPEFGRLLQSGVPVMHAFKVMHMDEIVSGAMQTTAKLTEKRVADSVRAKGNRPSENGASSQSAFTLKDDVNKLTKADRAEIARRAARGEIISF